MRSLVTFPGVAILVFFWSVPAAAQSLPHNIPYCPAGSQIVPSGSTLTVTNGQVLDCVQVESNATLRVPAGVTVHVTTILGLPGSTYDQAGEVVIRDVPPGDPETFRTGLLLLGNVSIHGQPLTTFARLGAEAFAGQTLQSLASSAGWQPTDQLVIPDTRHLRNTEIGSGFALQAEVVTAASPLRFDHLGARNEQGALEFLPHVGNLTRTCRIRSANPSGTRGHVMIHGTGSVDVAYCAFENLGRTTTAALGAGNQVGRYPLHFHHFRGPTGQPAGAPQFRVIGNAIYNTYRVTGTHKPKNGIVIHDTHFGLIEDNVTYQLDGTAYWTEDGSETENLFNHNLCVDVQGIGPRDAGAIEGVCFYARGPNSRWTNNVAANAYQSGVNESAYGFKIFQRYLGTIRVPNFPGADTTDNSQVTRVSAHALAVRQFEGNEVYASSNGMTYWWVGSDWQTPMGAPVTVFRNTVVWHVFNIGVYHYESSDVTHDDLVVRGKTPTSSAACCGVGIRMQDYYARNFSVRRADIQGVHEAIQVSSHGGPQVIEDSYLSADNDIVRTTLWSSNSAAALPPRWVVLRNVRYGSGVRIRSRFGATTGHLNYVQSDVLQVISHDGVVGDDFDLFWLEQAPGTLVPASGNSHVGAPVPGLTNQQALATYGLAVAGSIAPCATIRPGVDGYTCAAGSSPQPSTSLPANFDSDHDGVPDSLDLCPGTPPGTPVDPAGCPIGTGTGTASPSPSSPSAPSGSPAPSTGGCATSDPFVILGGGTCFQGNWYPPGMPIPGAGGTTTGSNPPPAPPPPPAPVAGGCVTSDPFTVLGGGTCWNSQWLPPGMPIPGTGSTPTGQPAPAPTTPGGCPLPDPFVILGGGTCVAGNWLPPGIANPQVAPAPSGDPSTSGQPGVVVSTSCATPDPFVALGGGQCANGNWYPPGMPIPGSTSTPTVGTTNAVARTSTQLVEADAAAGCGPVPTTDASLSLTWRCSSIGWTAALPLGTRGEMAWLPSTDPGPGWTIRTDYGTFRIAGTVPSEFQVAGLQVEIQASVRAEPGSNGTHWAELIRISRLR